MILSTTQANEIFDIIVSTGNFDNTNKSYTDYKRAEFVESLIEGNGISEYWYSSTCGSSMKVYFNKSFISTITFHAQSMNPIHEVGITENMNTALAEWLVKECAKESA